MIERLTQAKAERCIPSKPRKNWREKDRALFLTALEIQQAIQQAQTAFPALTGWQYKNETDGEYFGFSLWGQYVPRAQEPMPKHFFITLDTYEAYWYGHFTIGQPCYLWSSADVGDAHLIDTDACTTLAHAIATLQGEIGSLLRAFSPL